MRFFYEILLPTRIIIHNRANTKASVNHAICFSVLTYLKRYLNSNNMTLLNSSVFYSLSYLNKL